MARRVQNIAGRASGSSERTTKLSAAQSSGRITSAENSNPRRLRSALMNWGTVWGIQNLGRRVKIIFSPHLKRSLGRCDVVGHSISLNLVCKTLPRRKLLEILCHEAAHIAVREIYGDSTRPHGAEWQQLVRAAGYEARATTRLDTLNPAGAVKVGSRSLYRHRCPVCQMCRTAPRSMRSWRCAACVEVGLDGRLVITRVVQGRDLHD